MKRFRLPDGKILEAKAAPAVETTTQSRGNGAWTTTFAGPRRRDRVWIHAEKDKRIVAWPGGCVELALEEASAGAGGIAKELQPLKLTMPGKVVDVKIKAGDVVEKGQCLVVVEAMKMENNLLALGIAKVKKVHVKKDDRLESGATLVTFEAP